MTSKSDLFRPPRIAAWLVTLFTLTEETESILGDLREEFSQLAASSGFAFARRWYWRKVQKPSPISSALDTAPLRGLLVPP